MEFQELLKARRSVRKYKKDKPVSKEIITKLIDAAIESPSWKNQQTSRYYCVVSENMCKDFREKALPSFNAEHTEGAAYIVCTYIKDNVGFNTETGIPANEIANGWGCYDLGIQTENIILKAKELGLDTLIMGLRYSDAIKKMFDIPKNEDVVAVIAVGYADDTPERPAKKPTEEVAKFF